MHSLHPFLRTFPHLPEAAPYHADSLLGFWLPLVLRTGQKSCLLKEFSSLPCTEETSFGRIQERRQNLQEIFTNPLCVEGKCFVRMKKSSGFWLNFCTPLEEFSSPWRQFFQPTPRDEREAWGATAAYNLPCCPVEFLEKLVEKIVNSSQMITEHLATGCKSKWLPNS